MSERESFLLAVLRGTPSAPEIYHDWLEEQGDVEDAWRWLATPWPRTDAFHELLGGRKSERFPDLVRTCVLVADPRASDARHVEVQGRHGHDYRLNALRSVFGDEASSTEAAFSDPLAIDFRWRRISVAGAWLLQHSRRGDELHRLNDLGWIL